MPRYDAARGTLGQFTPPPPSRVAKFKSPAWVMKGDGYANPILFPYPSGNGWAVIQNIATANPTAYGEDVLVMAVLDDNSRRLLLRIGYDGKIRWCRRIADSLAGGTYGGSIAVGPDGNIAVSYMSASTGGTNLSLFTPLGGLLWTLSYSGSPGDKCPVAVGPDANIYWCPAATGATVYRISPQGTVTDSKTFTGGTPNKVGAVAVDGTGAVYVAGELSTQDGFIAKLDARLTAITWSRQFSIGGSGISQVFSINVTPDNGLLILLNGRDITATQAYTWVRRLNPVDGATLWTNELFSSGNTVNMSYSPASNSVIVAGAQSGVVAHVTSIDASLGGAQWSMLHSYNGAVYRGCAVTPSGAIYTLPWMRGGAISNGVAIARLRPACAHGFGIPFVSGQPRYAFMDASWVRTTPTANPSNGAWAPALSAPASLTSVAVENSPGDAPQYEVCLL